MFKFRNILRLVENLHSVTFVLSDLTLDWFYHNNLLNERRDVQRDIKWQIQKLDDEINALTQKLLINPSNLDIETGLISLSHNEQIEILGLIV